MDITREQLDEIMDAAELTEDDVRTDYSGRSMYGATCIAIYYSSHRNLMFLAVALKDVLGDLPEDVCTDQMGRGQIVYFPGLELVEDEEPEESDYVETLIGELE
jgi:uncharacterized protein YcgL (UPF0745 family)